MAKVMLGTGLIVAYAYATEFWTAWYSKSHYEQFVFLNRLGGPYAWAFWTMIFCNVVAPQFLWSKKLRTNLWALFVVAMFVNCGMWFERFVIIVTSLHRDYLPSSWAMYKPTWVDLGMLAGSFGLFFTLFLLFCRYLPIVAMAEVKTVIPQAHAHGGDEHRTHRRLDQRRTDYWPDEDHTEEQEHEHPASPPRK
jgi:molybdopterin-containing oxidoreductase family membrane subunit